MTYDINKPADDGFIADAPQELRANFEGIKNDQIVNAGTLNGLKSGNGQGQIPVSNGNVNTGLNADKLDGKDASEFANVQHNHSVATGSSDGFMSNTDKAKLDSIQAGAEVNQMAFSNVLIAGTTIQADSKADTLEMVAGANITLAPDAVNDKVTIAVSGKVESAINADYAAAAGSAPANGGNADTVDGKHANEFAPAGFGLGGDSKLLSNVDLDKVYVTGFYFVDVSCSKTPNGDYGSMIVICNSGNRDVITQLYYTIAGKNFSRVFNQAAYGGWSSWKQLATADQIPTSLPANGGNANTVGGHTFNWSGQAGQPLWLWGGNEAGDMYVYSPANFNVATAATSTNNVSILVGTVGHGGTIPLPSGYTHDQCKWIVSPYGMSSPFTKGSDAGVSTFGTIYCYVNGNRQCFCYINSGGYGTTGGIANYIVIGVK